MGKLSTMRRFTSLIFLLTVSALTFQIAIAQEVVINSPVALLTTSDTINKLEWHPNGDVLAVASTDGVKLYNQSLQLIAHIHAGNQIYAISWRTDGDQLAVTSGSGLEIWDWDTASQTLTYTLTLQGDNTQIGAFWSPDGTRIATIEVFEVNGEWLGTFHIWNTSLWQTEQLIVGTYGFEQTFSTSRRLAWAPNLDPLLVGAGYYYRIENGQYITDTNGSSYILNAGTGDRVQEIPMIAGGPATSVAWQPSGDLIAVGGLVGIELYSITTGEYVGPIGIAAETLTVDWSPNGRYIAGDNGISDVTTRQYLGRFERTTSIVAIDWHPNGSWLAVADTNGVLKVEDATLFPNFEPPIATATSTPTSTPTDTPTATYTPTDTPTATSTPTTTPTPTTMVLSPLSLQGWTFTTFGIPPDLIPQKLYQAE